jgi:hypothetical protein
MWRPAQGQIFPSSNFFATARRVAAGGLAGTPLALSWGMQRSNAATKEAAMAKVDLAKMCWTVMALGAFVFLTHSAFIAFAR